MKIEIERAGGGPVSFDDFADRNGFVMKVRERAHAVGTNAQCYAHFDHVEVMERGCLVGMYGDGSTPERAIEDYKILLLGRRIAFNAGMPDRREIQCPTEWL
jgi:hypothetical protein